MSEHFKKSTLFSDNQLAQLIDHLISDNIKFVCLFGSEATGLSNEFSDVDIALFTGKSEKISIQLQLKYINLIESLLSRQVDIIILDYTSIILSFNVIKEGILIFENRQSKNSFNEFKELIISRYPDFHYTIMTQIDIALGNEKKVNK